MEENTSDEYLEMQLLKRMLNLDSTVESLFRRKFENALYLFKKEKHLQVYKLMSAVYFKNRFMLNDAENIENYSKAFSDISKLMIQFFKTTDFTFFKEINNVDHISEKTFLNYCTRIELRIHSKNCLKLDSLFTKIIERKELIENNLISNLYIDGKLSIKELTLEEDVLKSMINSKSTIVDLMDYVHQEFFLDTKNQRIIDAITAIYGYSGNPDEETILKELQKDANCEIAVFRAYIDYLVDKNSMILKQKMSK